MIIRLYSHQEGTRYLSMGKVVNIFKLLGFFKNKI